MSDNLYSVLVLSCDKYSWLWDPFFKRFNYFWPDKAVKIYILTNYKKCNHSNITTVAIGEDLNWSENLLKCIDKINEKYIFVTFEDVFLNASVDKNYFEKIKKFIVDNEVEYVNTKANPLPKSSGHHKDLTLLKVGMHYRASLANAFWRKDILRDLLRLGESPWEFEHNGSKRSNKYSKFYGTNQPLLSFDHILVGGKITRKSAKLPDVLEIIPESPFPIMSFIENIIFDIKVVRNKLFSRIIPTTFQQKLRNAFRRI